jgi:hypothetical protein
MNQGLTMRAGTSAYIVFSLIFGYIAVLSVIAAVSNRSMLVAAVLAVGVLVLSWMWLITFRVTVSSESVSYTTLFRGTVTFDFTEIDSIRLESGIRGFADRFKPFVRIVIEPSKESHRQPAYVNIKILGSSAVAELKKALRMKFVDLGRPDVVKNL